MRRKPVYVCLPYHDHEFTMVYAGTQRPQTDGDIVQIRFDEDGEPYSMKPVQINGKQIG